jgi:hypothetical protein
MSNKCKGRMYMELPPACKHCCLQQEPIYADRRRKAWPINLYRVHVSYYNIAYSIHFVIYSVHSVMYYM